jgi:hypothetical protein
MHSHLKIIKSYKGFKCLTPEQKQGLTFKGEGASSQKAVSTGEKIIQEFILRGN